MAVEIREYRPADWDAIARAHDAARLQELAPSVGVEAFRPLAETAKREGLFDEQVWVAELDGEVVGFVAYAHAEVTWMYVHPESQQRGVGRALLRHALAHADDLGGEGYVTVTVLDGNPARKLYESEGFRLVETRRGGLAGNQDFAATGHVLERRL
ncbi:ribosomal protein S18 acetylase RimI-like enzyme [Blastococcus colisei]|uniref:Ribosomal protein S18 acetylase RimI-like enzyme n=1 Tax=Blastococcus colisei TaxID=1564162 RepID=A0A543NV49_9ACTN|nr:GNAT family N-acetyltransferase [Blastococcus colisei]TQN35690.1 ribosomal protein S18 acetylase RimI-like enzyme [Blastococcus colisei]